MSTALESAFIPLLISTLLVTPRVSSELYSESWSSTSAEKLIHNHTWILRNWDELSSSEDFEYIDSPEFSSPNYEKFKWVIRLSDYLDEWYNLHIKFQLCHTHDSNVNVKFTMTIGSVKASSSEFFNNESCSSEQYAKHDKVFKNILPNGALRINCVIRLETPHITQNSGSGKYIEPSIPISNQTYTKKIPHNFINLLENEIFSDITIVVDGKGIPAHRNILAVQSPVFAQLLVENGNSSIIEIKDVKFEVFRKLLRYIYTNEVDGIDNEMAKDLLVAAIKYDIKGLKAMCGEILCSNLNGINVIEVLLIADQQNMPELKLCTSKFIAEHA